MMIQKFLDSLEDPERPLLGPNYWLLRKIGFILPEKKINKVPYILIALGALYFVITEYVELFVLMSQPDFDLVMVLTNLKISVLAIVLVAKVFNFIMWQDRWKKLINYITEVDNFERENQDNARGKIICSYTKYCRRITYTYGFLCTLTMSVVLTTPVVKYYSSSFREGKRARGRRKNGTELFPHIYSEWMPFDKNSFPGNWATVSWQIMMAFYGSLNVCTYDTSAVVLMMFFRGQFELLRERCKLLLGSDCSGVSDKELLDNIRQVHTVHVQLTKQFRLFNSLLSPVMFVYVVINSFMLCASAYQLTTATNMFQKILMAEYLLFGITQLFMFCWHSDAVFMKCEEAGYGLYEGDWWSARISQRKTLMILQGQLQIKHQFTAGPFTNLTLSAFITILKGAYSYYTLLRD